MTLLPKGTMNRVLLFPNLFRHAEHHPETQHGGIEPGQRVTADHGGGDALADG